MPTWSMAGLHSPAALTAFELWGSRVTTVEVVASRLIAAATLLVLVKAKKVPEPLVILAAGVVGVLLQRGGGS